MWWRKKEQKQEELSAGIKVIPEEFYGAKDPVVHYKGVIMKGAPPAPVQSKENAGQATHGVSRLSAPRWLKSKKVKIILIIIFFVLVVAGISWYYIEQAARAKKLKNPITPVVTQEPAKEIVQPEEIVPTSTVEIIAPVEEIIVAPTSTEPTLEFPNVQMLDSADLDSDSLTDMEEEMFGIDPGKWDTDGDGYYDGQETFNLYNPQGIAPMKIIDSGLVKEYVNPTWQYRLYYPAQWALGTVEAEANHVLFSALSGDFIEVVAEKMNVGETFTDWFARKAIGEQFSDLQEFTNRFQENCWKRNDDMVAYFVRDNSVFVLIYHPGGLDTIPYRHVMQIVEQSFRPAKTTAAIPEQPIIPQEGL